MMMEMNKVENKGEVVVDVEDDDVVLPGFRFHPTDEELIGFYLRRKIEKKALSIEIIKEIDIYKYDPWDLPKSVTLGAKEWYFFCLRGRKYKNSIRPNRVTGSGFWKATGIDRPIYSSSESSTSSDCIGLKKSLVYYRGSAGKGTKTEWMMHEFRLPSSTKTNNIQPASMQEAEVWTICRIFKRNLSERKCQQNGLRQAVSRQQLATESSSKTSSFCSEVVNDYQNKKPIVSKYDGHVELRFNSSSYYDDNISHNNYDGQSWNNSVAQTPANAAIESTNSVPNHTTNEVFKDGTTNWDELGRIMDFMMSDQPGTWL